MKIKQLKGMNPDNSWADFTIQVYKEVELEGNARSQRDIFKMREISIHLYAYVGDQVDRKKQKVPEKEKWLEQSS